MRLFGFHILRHDELLERIDRAADEQFIRRLELWSENPECLAASIGARWNFPPDIAKEHFNSPESQAAAARGIRAFAAEVANQIRRRPLDRLAREALDQEPLDFTGGLTITTATAETLTLGGGAGGVTAAEVSIGPSDRP